MNTQKFEAFEKKLLAAKCPKDFFGDIPETNRAITFKQIIKEAYGLFEEITSGEKDTNQEYRVGMMTERLKRLSDWALEALLNGTYNQSLTYRSKLRFIVKEWLDKKYFFIEGISSACVLMKKIDAASFDGYLWNDEFKVLGETSAGEQGFVTVSGTHGATEYFSINEKKVPELVANDYELDDVVEIKTTRYSSASHFAKMYL